MQLIKKILISTIILLLFVVFAVIAIIVKNNVTARNYLSYWQEESLDEANYTMVIMGDSTAIGVGASSPQKSFAGLLKDKIQLKTNGTVKLIDLGSLNATYEDVLWDQLPKLSGSNPDLVVVIAGRTNVDKKILDIDRLDELLMKLPEGISYITTIPGNYLPDRNKIVMNFNKVLTNEAGHAGVNMIPLYEGSKKTQFDLSYYDWDFTHPNDKEYAIWADVAFSAIQ